MEIETPKNVPIPSIIPFFQWTSQKDRNEYFLSVGKNIILGFWTLACFFWCSFWVILVDSNLPSLEKHGYGLPDVVFEYFEYRQWLLPVSEKILGFFGILVVVLLLFHKSRCTILRRIGLCLSTLFVIRSFSMYMTRLPVPSEFALQCYSFHDQGKTSLWTTFKMAAKVTFLLGMEGHSGMVSCGDLIFSGHATAAAICCMFLWTYANFQNKILRVIEGIILMTAFSSVMIGLTISRIHYSVDVYLALFFSYLYYHYYHMHVREVQLRIRDFEQNICEEEVEKTILDYPLIPFFYSFETFEKVVTKWQFPWGNVPLERKRS